VPAVFFGAMRAGVVVVPLDLRMSADAVGRIAADSGARALALGAGLEAEAARLGLGGLPYATVESLTAVVDRASSAPIDDLAGPAGPGRDDVFEIIYTSGTTGRPKGVTLTHGNILSWVEACTNAIPTQRHRVVSLMPLSHVFGQLAELFYALLVDASVLYVRSMQPRVIFQALRAHRVSTMAVVPMALELFESAIEREAERRGRARRLRAARVVARHLPVFLRRRLFADVHAQLGGGLRLFISSGAALPPPVQSFWEDLGVTVLQGYGATECGIVCCATARHHEAGIVGRVTAPNELRLDADGQVLVRGPGVFRGYWNDPLATAEAIANDGSYRSGDLGHFDRHGSLVLHGRAKDMVVLPNGLNVYPEDVESALRAAGVPESVVVETEPGTLEAIVRAGERLDADGVAAAVREANRHLGTHQRVQRWQLWPDADFPRTHTLKVRRAAVREWAMARRRTPAVA